jgi:hypothetical protein
MENSILKYIPFLDVCTIKNKDCIILNTGHYYYKDVPKEELLHFIEMLNNTVKHYDLVNKEVEKINQNIDLRMNEYSNHIKEPIDNSGFIYIVKCNHTGYYKIGYTKNKNPNERIKQLKHTNPTIEKVNVFFTHDVKDEHEWHLAFETQRINGEWFNLSKLDLNFIQSYYTKRNLF